MKRITLIAALVALSGICSAKIELPAILGSNMVIQQNADASLWGKATPKATVTVTTGWDNAKATTKADKDGRWMLTVKTPAASLEAYSITISDGEAVTLDNVLVGDVWLCSGQSNMDMRMVGNKSQPIIGSADKILSARACRPIRVFKIGRVAATKPQEDIKASWKLNTPDVVAQASAVAYFFADFIQNALDIPIGLVQPSWGGSSIEAWMNKETIEKSFKGKYDFSHLEAAEYKEKDRHKVPSLLYNGMIAPLEPFAIKGILWYQGCTNRGRYADYAQLQADFVGMLRKEFKSPDAPFYFVQIAPYGYGKSNDFLSGYFCEAQEKFLSLCPNSGMATTVDVGEEFLIHPAHKEEVGKRLAYLALEKTYGVKAIEAEAPRVADIKFEKGKAFIKFSGCSCGLVPKRGNIDFFELAGEDKVFHTAKAFLNEKKGCIEVSSEEVPSPVAVRYCFRNWAVGTLKNNFGIPVGPFRSDNWEYEASK